MATTSANMALRIPVAGDTDYPTSVTTSLNNIDTHSHNGTNSLQVAVTSLTGINQFIAEYQATTFAAATGSTTVVTTAFSGKTSGGGASVIGVITTASENRVELRQTGTLASLSDSSGNLVFGRITEAAGVWTLSYFSFVSGAEVAYTLPGATDLTIYFKEVFNQATRPSIPVSIPGGSGSGSSSSSSGINYVLNGQATADTSGWATYADAAASRPVDGTGGAATVTFTRSTSSALRGAASFLFTKDAANRQGEGASYALTIDSADQAKVLQISFDYAIFSGTYSGGTSSTDSDCIVSVYRTTATGRLIEPTPIKLDGAVVGQKYQYRGTFQTDSDAAGYRLVLHVATTSASAYVVQLDNVAVSPVVYSIGSITTDWRSYTVTPVNFGNGTAVGAWRRIGDSMQVRGILSVGSSLPSAGGISFNLPSGYSIDQTAAKGGGSTVSRLSYGKCAASPSGAATHTGDLLSSGTTSLFPSGDDGAGQWTNTVPYTFVNGDSITFFGEFPVVGWGSSVVVSNETDTRIVAARASTTTQSYTSGALTTAVGFSVLDFDTHAALSASNSRFSAPISGKYSYSFALPSAAFAGAAGGTTVYGQVKKNGALYQEYRNTTPPTVNDEWAARGSDLIDLKAGDFIELFYFNSSTSSTLQGGKCFFEVTRLSGPSQIAASEIVEVRATGSTTAYSSGGSTILFPTILHSTHGTYVAGTGLFTAPKAGFCTVSLKAQATGVAAAATDSDVFQLVKNGSVQSEICIYVHPSGVAIQVNGFGTVTIAVVAGDVLSIRALCSYGGTSFVGDNFVEFSMR